MYKSKNTRAVLILGDGEECMGTETQCFIIHTSLSLRVFEQSAQHHEKGEDGGDDDGDGRGWGREGGRQV